MVLFKIINFFIIFILFIGCSQITHTENSVLKKEIFKDLDKTLPFEEKKNLTNLEPLPLLLETKEEKIDYLETKMISINVNNASIIDILYSFVQHNDINLIIEEKVLEKYKNNVNNTIALKLNDVNLKKALKILMDMTDLYYEYEDKVLYVKLFKEETFYIPYVKSVSSFNSNLGGNMLGEGDEISGNFNMQFNNKETNNDFYTSLENNLEKLISEDGLFELNKFSGILYVKDYKKYVDKISNFLSQLENIYNKQIVIEAKIFELIFNDQTEVGVNWNRLLKGITYPNDTLNLVQNTLNNSLYSNTISYSQNNYELLISGLNEYGKIETLANPRITLLSGQSALITSGQITPYWEKEITYNETGTNGNLQPQETYERRDVLDGISLGVTATVLKDNSIMMNIIPITSNVESTREHMDQNGNVVASAPILNIKETGSIIKVHNNEMIVLGGLIDKKTSYKDNGLPILKDFELIGNFFKNQEDIIKKRELIIILKPKILEN